MNSKEKIITAAEELFWLKGYKNTSVTDILEKAEVSKGSFFHFFPDKKALFLEVIDYFYAKEMIPLFEKHFKSNKNPKQQILDFCENINISYQKYQFYGGCLLGNMALELADIDEVFREKLDEIFENWKQELIKVLEKIETKKSADEIADYIIWGIEGLTLTGKVHKTKVKNQSEFEIFKDVLESLMEIR
jgi:TetR/AcrR family transcriptional repressor of nem operon